MSYCRWTITVSDKPRKLSNGVTLQPTDKRQPTAAYIAGDVYFYANCGGGFVCCQCTLTSQLAAPFRDVAGYLNKPLWHQFRNANKLSVDYCGQINVWCASYAECIAHFMLHLENDDCFPVSAVDQLWEEWLAGKRPPRIERSKRRHCCTHTTRRNGKPFKRHSRTPL